MTFMTFQVLTAARMNMIVFWDIAPCSMAVVYRRFRVSYCLYHQSDESLVILVGLPFVNCLLFILMICFKFLKPMPHFYISYHH